MCLALRLCNASLCHCRTLAARMLREAAGPELICQQELLAAEEWASTAGTGQPAVMMSVGTSPSTLLVQCLDVQLHTLSSQRVITAAEVRDRRLGNWRQGTRLGTDSPECCGLHPLLHERLEYTICSGSGCAKLLCSTPEQDLDNDQRSAGTEARMSRAGACSPIGSGCTSSG